MCMSAPKMPAPAPIPVIPPPPVIPAAQQTNTYMRPAKRTSSETERKKRNPLRTDDQTGAAGAPVATGLNIPL